MGNRFVVVRFLLVALASLLAPLAQAQSLSAPWSSYAHDPQHTGISTFPGQDLNRIKWSTPVEVGSSGLIHYGSPLVTAGNTVVFPVKTGPNVFQVEARRGSNGTVVWQMATDYALPPYSWVPSVGPVLNLRNRVYIPGEGGTVLWRDNADSATGATGRIAFYGNATYSSNAAALRSTVFINTPITADRYGNLFFGVQVTGTNPAGLTTGGIARISSSGVGTFVTASSATGDSSIRKAVHSCAPALSNDHKTLYIAVSNGGGTDLGATGYLLALNTQTLATVNKVRLKDPKTPTNDAFLPEQGSASPTVGPDGDVYFGVLENPFPSHTARGWLLHFDSALTPKGVPGSFGWDDTASIVPAVMVPSYKGTSRYLLMTKYNHYAGIGGSGVNKLAILDPNASQRDSVGTATVMKEILTIAGITPDNEFPSVPGAVREWCINTAVVDPRTNSVFANCEDGRLYRWDLKTNTLSQSITLTSGVGEAYTPTIIGVDGTVYAINNKVLFAVGF